MANPRLLIIGGKPFNVPPRLKDYFEIARHVEQEERKLGTLPTVDYILVITNWVNHGAIATARKVLPGVPVIWVRKGWPAMSAELRRRGLIPEEAVAPEPEVPEAPEPVAAGEPKEDEFASMTEEQLEAATRPEVQPVQETAVPQTPALPAPVTAPTNAETPKRPDAYDIEMGKLWQGHVMKFVGDTFAKFGADMTKAVEFFSVALHEEFAPEDLKKEFGLSDDDAHGLYVSFGKSRGQFRAKWNLPPIHTRAKVLKPRPAPVAPPVPVPSEVDRMLQEYTRLTQEKSKLLEEQHVLEGKIEAVNKQLDIMKPFADHFKGLAAAAKKVREALEQQQRRA